MQDDELMKKKMQDKYMEFQMAEQQLKQLQGNIENVDGQLLEIRSMKQAVEDIAKIGNSTEILVPIANGVFVKGSLSDNSTILLNVGSNVIVDKTIAQTTDLLQKQSEEISQVREQLMSEMTKLATKLQHIEADLNEMVSSSE